MPYKPVKVGPVCVKAMSFQLIVPMFTICGQIFRPDLDDFVIWKPDSFNYVHTCMLGFVRMSGREVNNHDIHPT